MRLFLKLKALSYILLASTLAHAAAYNVVEASKQGTHQQSIYSALEFISAKADASCTTALPGLKEMVTSLEGDKANEQTILVGHGTFEALTAAFTGNDGSVPEGYFITVNDTSTFFTDRVPNKPANYQEIAHKYRGGTAQAQVFILMHELGHALSAPGFIPDLSSTKNVAHNDAIVEASCQSVIRPAGKRQPF